MALKVWLPLSGNTTNYGLSNVPVYTKNTQYGNGILGGRCFNTDTTHYIYGFYNIPFDASEFTITAWIKEGNSISTGAVIFALQKDESDEVKENIILLEKTSNGGYGIPTLTSEELIPSLSAGWNHIAISANGTMVKAYLNGALVKETSQTSTGTVTVNEDCHYVIGGKVNGNIQQFSVVNNWIGSICGFKLYDNELSLFEVAAEANALVLNYSFNGKVSLGTGVTLPAGTTTETFGFGDKEYDLSGNMFDGTFGENLPTSSSDTAMYSNSMDFSESSGITSANIITTEFASRYTISIWAKGTGNILSIGDWDVVSATDANDWHNIVVTSAGKKYVDGIETGTVSGSMPTGANAVVVGLGFSGKLSDLRIYAKQMTADEIATLYTRKAAVDNTGKLIATEFIVDDEIEKPSFNKKGVISTAGLDNWTGESDSPVDVTSFSIVAETGDVKAVDVMEF